MPASTVPPGASAGLRAGGDAAASPDSTSPANNLAGLLDAAAARAATHTAIIAGDRSVTYGELRERAAAFVEVLTENGVRTGDRVVVFLERGPDAAVAYFGTLAAGGVAVLANEHARPRQLEHLLTRTDARLLVTSAALVGRQPRELHCHVPLVQMDQLRLDPGAAALDPAPRRPSDLAQIIFTSGSTGLPKGVMVSHANLSVAVDVVASYLGVSGADRVASLLPFSSVYGLNQLLCAIRSAATLVVADSPIPHELVTRLRHEEVTILAAVPPLWHQLLETPSFAEPGIDSIRILQNAGGHLPETAVRRLRALYPDAGLFLQYGLTEVIRSTFLPPEEVDRRPNSMGRAIPGAEIRVLRDDLTPCAPGEVGELVHKGPTVALGYWDDDDATAIVFRPDPLAPAGTAPERVVFSGDLVRQDNDGFLYFVGRRDRVIKTLGYRVGPDEVASVLHASGEIRDAVVAGERDPRRGERIIAYVVLADGGSLHRLRTFCQRELPRYMQPARFELRDQIPRTSSGKHDLLALRQPAR